MSKVESRRSKAKEQYSPSAPSPTRGEGWGEGSKAKGSLFRLMSKSVAGHLKAVRKTHPTSASKFLELFLGHADLFENGFVGSLFHLFAVKGDYGSPSVGMFENTVFAIARIYKVGKLKFDKIIGDFKIAKRNIFSPLLYGDKHNFECFSYISQRFFAAITVRKNTSYRGHFSKPHTSFFRVFVNQNSIFAPQFVQYSRGVL